MYFLFFMYFVVLAYWIEDVNNFLTCESRMMSTLRVKDDEFQHEDVATYVSD
jgi:hypothetical protein